LFGLGIHARNPDSDPWLVLQAHAWFVVASTRQLIRIHVVRRGEKANKTVPERKEIRIAM